MEFKGSQTEKNLLKAFAGESQARNRYTYFASQAGKDGFVQIQAIFEETADQEREHAKRFFKFLRGGEVEIAAAFPAGTIGTTAENLRAAAGGEHHEWSSMYPDFAKTAKKEGLEEIAAVFEAVSVAEKQHERRYLGFLKNVEAGAVFKKQDSVAWRCRNCGYFHTGTEAPALCPACAHPQAHFELVAENW
jgi:rubrerythrin